MILFYNSTYIFNLALFYIYPQFNLYMIAQGHQQTHTGLFHILYIYLQLFVCKKGFAFTSNICEIE